MLPCHDGAALTDFAVAPCRHFWPCDEAEFRTILFIFDCCPAHVEAIHVDCDRERSAGARLVVCRACDDGVAGVGDRGLRWRAFDG